MVDIKVGSESKSSVAGLVLSNADDVRQYNPKDPYDTESEHLETNDFIFNTFFFWTGAGGTFSTWRERHIFLRGFFNGFNTGLQEKFTAVPEMWEDEAQYYEAGQEAGYLFKAGILFAVAGSGGTGIALNAGTIMQTIMSLLGMG